ncbi:hypothetical protein V1511DRAFT_491539 [Dipodascopsis uninucleata]
MDLTSILNNGKKQEPCEPPVGQPVQLQTNWGLMSPSRSIRNQSQSPTPSLIKSETNDRTSVASLVSTINSPSLIGLPSPRSPATFPSSGPRYIPPLQQLPAGHSAQHGYAQAAYGSPQYSYLDSPVPSSHGSHYGQEYFPQYPHEQPQHASHGYMPYPAHGSPGRNSPVIGYPLHGGLHPPTSNPMSADPNVHHQTFALKQFVCSTCTKRFARRSDLARHERIHTGVKPHVCEVCSKPFIQRSALTVHLRVHTGEKPHKCNTCDKAFSDSSSLARHRRVHTGKRPYQCNQPGCAKTFTRRTTLTRHLNTHACSSVPLHPAPIQFCDENEAYHRPMYTGTVPHQPYHLTA